MAATEKVAATSPVVTGAKRKAPVVTKVTGGVKVEDKDGYYQVAPNYFEATKLVQDLTVKGNSVMYMNGFESAKWKAPETWNV